MLIPTLNRAPSLRKILENIEGQALPVSIEITISANASKVGMASVVTDFLEK